MSELPLAKALLRYPAEPRDVSKENSVSEWREVPYLFWARFRAARWLSESADELLVLDSFTTGAVAVAAAVAAAVAEVELLEARLARTGGIVVMTNERVSSSTDDSRWDLRGSRKMRRSRNQSRHDTTRPTRHHPGSTGASRSVRRLATVRFF